MKYARAIFDLLRESAVSFGRDRGSLLAAALAYYTILSLAPLLVISVAVAGFVFGEAAVEGQLVEQIEGVVGREIAITIERLIEGAAIVNTSSVVATTASVAFLFIGASGVFRQLKIALNMIWGIARKPEQGLLAFVKTRFLAFTMVLGIGFLLLASVAMSILLTSLRRYLTIISPLLVDMLPRLDIVVAMIVVTIGFAIIFRILPDAEVAWRDVWLGAVVTSILFTLGEYLIGLYLAYSSVGSAYGAAGSLLVILTWIYYSALILMFGAEFTKAYANKHGSKIRPSDNAHLVAIPQAVEVARQPDLPVENLERTGEVHPPKRQVLRQAAAALMGMAFGLLLAFVSSWRRKQ